MSAIEKFVEVASKKIKRDISTSKAIFFTMLSAYTNDPINLYLKGPSSIGKSYLVSVVSQYFPEEDVWSLADASPRAFVHELSVPIDEHGEVIPEAYDVEKEGMSADEIKEMRLRMKKSKRLVNLEKKIAVFYETPNPFTMARLRPILSHDKAELEYRFVDRPKGGMMRTIRVVVQGWPATIFADTSAEWFEDFVTRGFTATPEMSKSKYQEAIQMVGFNESDIESPDEDMEAMRNLVRIFKVTAEKYTVKIPYAGDVALLYPHEISRDMRDYKRFLALVKVITLLRASERARMVAAGKTYLLSAAPDFKEALIAFSRMELTTRTGLPGDIVSLYESVLLPMKAMEYFTLTDVVAAYKKAFGRSISRQTVRDRAIKALLAAGLIDRLSDDDVNKKDLDRRMVAYTVIALTVESITKSFDQDFGVLFPKERFLAWYERQKVVAGNGIEFFSPADARLDPDQVYGSMAGSG